MLAVRASPLLEVHKIKLKKMLQVSELIRFSDKKPSTDKVVLFVWWHRNGIETSQKTLGFLDTAGVLHLDFTPVGQNKTPTFWCPLFS
jgi:hypothetical protein